MATHKEIVDQFAEEAGRVGGKLDRSQSGNMHVNPDDERELLSYGSHYVLARIMLDENGDRAWWLLNGDKYSVSTNRHQELARLACQRTGLPVMIVPFTVLHQARIVTTTIHPIDVKPDHFERVVRHAATRDDVPDPHRAHAWPDGDRWAWSTHKHVLGSALFEAEYRDETGTYVTARFLSAFDEQETSHLHYFLCQLPEYAEPDTVEEAFTALRPQLVRDADAEGLPVVRQGDVFAVPTTLSTREITALAGKRMRSTRVLDLGHKVTETAVTDDGRTYARGILHHVSDSRGPRHKRQPMGDRATWYRLCKNTVPVDAYGDNRAWSAAGDID